MSDYNILLEGNIYFFYRPKIDHHNAHNIGDVQRFFMLLKPTKINKYILFVVGKKHLPDHNKNERSYFSFIEKVTDNLDELIKSFKEQIYTTPSQGERDLPEVRCLGEGKFIIADHKKHAHFIYKLTKPEEIGEVQKDFNLEPEEDFIISVKNPNKSSPVSLDYDKKAKYKKELQDTFGDYRFIPLIPVDFIFYEGAELLIIRKGDDNIQESEEIEQCFEKINLKDITKKLEKILDEESVAPMIDKNWV